MRLEDAAVRAVVDLHADLESWIGHGSDAAWVRFERALAADFTMITPDGTLNDRAAVVAAVEALAGVGGTGFSISVEGACGRAFGPDVVLVTYRELQTGGGRPASARWSTALLTPGEDGPLQWRHLHECWAR